MNFEQAVSTIRKYVNTAWGNTSPLFQDDEDASPPDNKSWARLSISQDDGAPISIGDPGNNIHRMYGQAIMQIFQPKGKAGKDAQLKASAAVAMFLGKQIEGISFNKTFARPVGSDEHGWYQVNVIARFDYDQIA